MVPTSLFVASKHNPEQNAHALSSKTRKYQLVLSLTGRLSMSICSCRYDLEADPSKTSEIAAKNNLLCHWVSREEASCLLPTTQGLLFTGLDFDYMANNALQYMPADVSCLRTKTFCSKNRSAKLGNGRCTA